jgi:hypothetical protein
VDECKPLVAGNSLAAILASSRRNLGGGGGGGGNGVTSLQTVRQGLTDYTRHDMRFYLTPETRVYNVKDAMLSDSRNKGL